MYILYIVSLVLNWFSNLEFWRQKKLSKLGGCNLDKIQKNSSFSSWNRPLVSQLPSRKISDVVFKPWIRAGNTSTCQWPVNRMQWLIDFTVCEWTVPSNPWKVSYTWSCLKLLPPGLGSAEQERWWSIVHKTSTVLAVMAILCCSQFGHRFSTIWVVSLFVARQFEPESKFT